MAKASGGSSEKVTRIVRQRLENLNRAGVLQLPKPKPRLRRTKARSAYGPDTQSAHRPQSLPPPS